MEIPHGFSIKASHFVGEFLRIHTPNCSSNVLRLGDFYWGMCHNGGGWGWAPVCGTSNGNNDCKPWHGMG